MTSQEKAQNYFKNNPSIEELFSTSDKTLFLRKIDAFNHAKTLENQNVEDHQNTLQTVKEVIVPKGLLDRSITEIVEVLDDYTKDEIYSYLEAEKKDKNRKTLIKVLEEQLAKFDHLKTGNSFVESGLNDDVNDESSTGETSQEDNNDNK
ncbi:hypothetical protein HX001_00100 [Empedobacter brevis]|uniref:Uncharacterized protein n=1 Tax=Empedobacter brevis TaxID=247 RepID=A0AAJ1QB35_9FLAO|nr:hypothetical protein [Empedobacter brevis]MDM1070886.1 hypothetical protein [Empedobacter brevis]